jgi:glycosyltransferase involved in cell wall biosynthesis
VRVFGFHDTSGCGRYRVIFPLTELAKNGHEVRIEAGWTEEARGYPLIIGQRMDKHDALPIWRRLRATSRLVYEIDDDIFSVEKVNWMAHRVYSKPIPQDTVIHAAEVAHLVTVTTEPLAEVMRQFNPNVAVLPNHIPSFVFDLERPRRDKVVVGWSGGASHGADMAMIAPQLRRLVDKVPNVEMHLVGTDYSPTVGRLCRFTPWEADPEVYFRNFDFDIGIAPLTGTRFDRSKSNVKVLEYAALGIPAVASDVDAYRDFVIDGVTGYLVRSEHEWFKRLRELANDAAMREEMGAKAKQAARGFDIGEGWKLWAAAYEGLLS